MNVALYCRVSSQEQAKEGLSLSAQLSHLRNWAEVNGHSVIGEYVDAGVSGRKPLSKRPALLQFVNDLEMGVKVDALVFIKLDRFFRSVKLYYQAMDVLDKYKVSWITTLEDYETVTSQGKLVVNIMLSIAEAESSRTGDRVRFVIDRKIALGEHVGCKPPIGYDIINKHLVPNDEADIIKNAFQLFLDTGSVVEVMKHLHAHGHTINYNSSYRLLENPIYKGSLHGNDSYCEPIISAQDFEATQGLLKRRSVRTNQTGRVYLFSGLMKCAGCGRTLTGNYQYLANGEIQYRYRCNGRYQDHLCDRNGYTNEAEVEDLLLSRIESEIKSMSTTIAPKKKSKPVDNSKKLERLTELYVDGLISKEEYQSRRDALSIPTTTPPQSPLKKINLSGSVREVYQGMTRQEKRVFWRNAIESVEIDGKSVTCTFR